MIKTKSDLKYYMSQDAIALGKDIKKHPKLFGDEIWKFQRTLRKCEYYSNLDGGKRILFLPLLLIEKIKFKKMSLKLNFSIPINVFREGLAIVHYGTIVVSKSARIGKNCRIHEGVNIGSTNGSEAAPQIGNNVFIGTGRKLSATSLLRTM